MNSSPRFSSELMPYHSLSLSNRFDKKNFNSGLEADEFLDELICALDNPTSVSAKAFEKFEVPVLIDYLQNCHTEYLNKHLPAIQRLLNEALSPISESHSFRRISEILLRECINEIKAHFRFEEEFLFPYALEVYNNPALAYKHYSTARFEKEHPEQIIDIDKLAGFIEAKLVFFKDNFAYRILIQRLKDLRVDMYLHGIIEDEVLIPKIKMVELA